MGTPLPPSKYLQIVYEILQCASNGTHKTFLAKKIVKKSFLTQKLKSTSGWGQRRSTLTFSIFFHLKRGLVAGCESISLRGVVSGGNCGGGTGGGGLWSGRYGHSGAKGGGCLFPFSLQVKRKWCHTCKDRESPFCISAWVCPSNSQYCI